MLRFRPVAIVGAVLSLSACAPPPATPPSSKVQAAAGSIATFTFEPDRSYLVLSGRLKTTILFCGVAGKRNFATTSESGSPVCITSALDASEDAGLPLPTFYVSAAHANARLTGQGGETFYVFDLDNLGGGDQRVAYDQNYVMTALLPAGGRWVYNRKSAQFPYRFVRGGIYAPDKNEPGVVAFIEDIRANRPDVADRLVTSGDAEVELLCANTPGVIVTIGPVIECELKPKA